MPKATKDQKQIRQFKATIDKLTRLSFQRKALLDQIWQLEQDAEVLRDNMDKVLGTPDTDA